MAIKVYKYYEDFRRMGNLTGLFLADEDDVAAAQDQEVYLGEVLGKHSEVIGTIDSRTVVLASEDPAVIFFVDAHLGGSMGINIIQHWKNREEYDEEE
jgi:hypothetical protein